MRTVQALTSIFCLAAAVCKAASLTVWLHDYSGLKSEQLARVTEAAVLPLRHAGIHVNWIHCRGGGATAEPGACEGDMNARGVIVRLKARETSAREGELASAIVTADGGQYATVLVSRVREFAAQLELPFELTLGYAVAHEVGHCLLGPKHSVAGLMRGRWTRGDRRDLAEQRLGLSNPEARRAVERLKKAAEPQLVLLQS